MFALALTASFGLITPAAASAAPAVQTFTITANSAFSPAQITVHAGRPVEITFAGAGGVHGVASTELGIPATMIMPNSSKAVTFTPQKPGSYVLHCTIVCGSDHSKMTLLVTVVA